MREYHFKDVLFKNKKKTIIVENAKQEHIGSVQMIDIEGCEQGSSFSYAPANEKIVQMGIQKRRLKNILFLYIRSSEAVKLIRSEINQDIIYYIFVSLGRLTIKQLRLKRIGMEISILK